MPDDPFSFAPSLLPELDEPASAPCDHPGCRRWALSYCREVAEADPALVRRLATEILSTVEAQLPDLGLTAAELDYASLALSLAKSKVAGETDPQEGVSDGAEISTDPEAAAGHPSDAAQTPPSAPAREAGRPPGKG